MGWSAMSALSQRYYRSGEKSGMVLWLVYEMAGRGPWRLPLAVRTKRSSIRDAQKPLPGVVYEGAMVVTNAEEQTTEGGPLAARQALVYQQRLAAGFVAIITMYLGWRAWAVCTRLYWAWAYLRAQILAAMEGFTAMGEIATEWVEWIHMWTTWIEHYARLFSGEGISLVTVAIVFGTALFWIGKGDSEARRGTTPVLDDEGVTEEQEELSPREVSENLVMPELMVVDVLETLRPIKEELSETQTGVMVGDLGRPLEGQSSGSGGGCQALSEEDRKRIAEMGRMYPKATPSLATLHRELTSHQPANAYEGGEHVAVGGNLGVVVDVLNEVYSTDLSGEEWGKNFLKERGLGESHTAKELVAGLRALDAIVLGKREPGWWDRGSVRKLARRVIGLIDAITSGEREVDWI